MYVRFCACRRVCIGARKVVHVLLLVGVCVYWLLYSYVCIGACSPVYVWVLARVCMNS